MKDLPRFGDSTSKRLLRKVRFWSGVCCLGYIGILGWIKWSEPELVFPGAFKPRPIPLPELPDGARRVPIKTADGLVLSAHELDGLLPSKVDHWAIFCPGQWGRQDWDMPKIQLLRELGLAVLLVDYRGYEGNPGRPSEQGLLTDADAVWQHVRSKGIRAEHILIYGHSLGSGVAVGLAARQQPGALVVDGAYDTIVSCGAERYLWLPIAWISSQRFPSVEKVSAIRCPKLFLHGAYDSMIPPTHGRALFEAAASPKQWVVLRGRHEDFQWIDAARWRQTMVAFVCTWMGAPQ